MCACQSLYLLLSLFCCMLFNGIGSKMLLLRLIKLSRLCVSDTDARYLYKFMQNIMKKNKKNNNIMWIFITCTISSPLNDNYFDYFHLHMWAIVFNKTKTPHPSTRDPVPSLYKLSTALHYRLFLETKEFTSTHIDFAALLMRELIRIIHIGITLFIYLFN